MVKETCYSQSQRTCYITVKSSNHTSGNKTFTPNVSSQLVCFPLLYSYVDSSGFFKDVSFERQIDLQCV